MLTSCKCQANESLDLAIVYSDSPGSFLVFKNQIGSLKNAIKSALNVDSDPSQRDKSIGVSWV